MAGFDTDAGFQIVKLLKSASYEIIQQYAQQWIKEAADIINNLTVLQLKTNHQNELLKGLQEYSANSNTIVIKEQQVSLEYAAIMRKAYIFLNEVGEAIRGDVIQYSITLTGYHTDEGNVTKEILLNLQDFLNTAVMFTSTGITAYQGVTKENRQNQQQEILSRIEQNAKDKVVNTLTQEENNFFYAVAWLTPVVKEGGLRFTQGKRKGQYRPYASFGHSKEIAERIKGEWNSSELKAFMATIISAREQARVKKHVESILRASMSESDYSLLQSLTNESYNSDAFFMRGDYKTTQYKSLQNTEYSTFDVASYDTLLRATTMLYYYLSTINNNFDIPALTTAEGEIRQLSDECIKKSINAVVEELTSPLTKLGKT